MVKSYDGGGDMEAYVTSKSVHLVPQLFLR